MSSLYVSGATLNPDVDETEYVLWSGAFPGANGRNMQAISKHVAQRLKEGKLKIDVVDPSLQSSVITPTMPGVTWVPIKPATNGALYSAIAQIMIRDNTYDKVAVCAPNQKAALSAGYGAFSNSTHLVIVDEEHPSFGKLMRASDAGIDAGGAETEPFVVIDAETGEPAVHTASNEGVLEFDGEVNGVHVRTAFSLTVESVNARTLDEYAAITGVSVSEMERIAAEYASHGVKASVMSSYGSTASVNGFDTPFGREVLRALIGSNQMIGGSVPAGGSPVIEGKGVRYDTGTIVGAPKISAKNATIISRSGKAWHTMSEYKNRVAAGEKNPKPKLPWYPMAKQSDSQALMSAVNQYPYQCKIMLTWMCNILQATPGGMRDEVIERLKDPAVVPLHVCCDIVIGEMAQLADYIVPDLTMYESFGVPSVEFPNTSKGATVRWQAKTPEVVKIDDVRYAGWEHLLIDIAKACELPGWGADAFKDNEGNSWPFDNEYDYYLKVIANLAYVGEPVEDISEEEMKLQALDELPASFKNAVRDEEWPKIQRVLSRGGRYWPGRAAKGDESGIVSEKDCMTLMYNEARATSKNSYSGGHLSGTLCYTPEAFADLSLMTDHYSTEEFPFKGSEHKPRFRSISMLADSPIMQDLCNHNYIELSIEDARELGIEDGDAVRAVTPRGDVTEGVAMVHAGQVKGAFSLSFGYEHQNYGAQNIEIDGALTEGDPAIAAGSRIHAMLDPTVEADGALMFLTDNDASSPGRCGGMYKIEKA